MGMLKIFLTLLQMRYCFLLWTLLSKYLNDRPTIRPTDIQYKLMSSYNLVC